MTQRLQAFVQIQLTIACAQLPDAFVQTSHEESQAWQELRKVHVSDLHLASHQDLKSVFDTPFHYTLSLSCFTAPRCSIARAFATKRTHHLANDRERDLPGEIRNMIYKMALTDPSGAIHIVHDWDGPRRDIARHRLFLGIGKRPFSPNQNLLATSKTVRGEALGFLYHQPFIFEDPRALKEFMLLMTPTTVAQLRDIALGFYDSMLSTDCFRLLRGAVGLRKLKLLGSFRTYPVPTTYRMLYKRDTISALTLATRFYDMFYCFIQTFTAQHGVDALMDVVELPHMDLHDDEYSTAVPMGTTPDHVACMDEREKRILAEVKEHITRWVNKFPEL